MIKCAACGQFIAYADIHAGRADQTYIPDSEFSRECLEFVCPACVAKEAETTECDHRGECLHPEACLRDDRCVYDH